MSDGVLSTTTDATLDDDDDDDDETQSRMQLDVLDRLNVDW